MLQTMSLIFSSLLLVAIVLINKKKARTFEEELREELLSKGIV